MLFFSLIIKKKITGNLESKREMIENKDKL